MGFHFLYWNSLLWFCDLWFVWLVITNHTNHTIILRTFHYYCYKSLHYILLFINKVLYYMGFHFLVLKFLIMILWFVIFVIAIFLLHCQPLCFSVLLFAGRWGETSSSRTQSTFGYLPVGQLVASVFAELAARVPRKMLVFEEIVINFAKRKRKKASPASPPSPSPSGEGSD